VWVFGMLLVLLTFAVYQPVWRAGFIWDDDTLLLQNPGIQTSAGLTQLWTSDFPLATSTLWLEWRLWGPNPLGYHLVNVLLHALSAVLLWRVLKGLKIAGAGLAAAIFAVHPVNVESVAWISERKNTLCMFFYVSSVLLYLRSISGEMQIVKSGVQQQTSENTLHAPRSTLFYVLSLLAFACALLSKTAVAPLPIVLLGLAWWQRGRLKRRDVLRIVPFFILAAPAGLVSLWYQTHQAIGASLLDVRHDTFGSRLAGAGWAVWFYLYKALLPLNLSFIYPRWHINSTMLWSYVPGVLVVAAILLFWLYRRSWGKPLLLGMGYFVVMLGPILGFANIYFMRYSLVADHWQYFAIIGPITLVAVGIAWLCHARGRGRCWLYNAVRVLLVLMLGVLTWREAAMYKDLKILWTTTVARNPGSGIAHNNLATILLAEGKISEAIGHLEKAVAIEPNAADVRSNLGAALLRQGRIDEAIVQLRQAIRIQPDSVQAHINLGNALSQQGQTAEALMYFQKATELQPGAPHTWYSFGSALLEAERVDDAIVALRRSVELDPKFVDAQLSLGNALLRKGQVSEGLAHLEEAVRINPGLAASHYTFGNALIQVGRSDDAIKQFQEALKIQPDFAPAENGLGNASFQRGQLDQAITYYRRALSIAPRFAEAHLNLANALAQKTQIDEAIAEFNLALELQPDLPEAHNNLGNILLGRGEVDKAVAQFQTALRLRQNFPEAHNNLANAFLRLGRPKEAVGEYEAALSVAGGNPELLNNLAWLLATCPEPSVRDGKRAAELAQQATQVTGGNIPQILGTLAAAWAESGQFKEAIATTQRALEMAIAQTNTTQIEIARTRLKLYQANEPFRDEELRPRASVRPDSRKN
jgi:tetratricopeptide (TPR) repeat protein